MFQIIDIIKQAAAGAGAAFAAGFPAAALISDLSTAKAALVAAVAAGLGVLAGGLGNLIKQVIDHIRGF
jgi:hypothetical protein